MTTLMTPPPITSGPALLDERQVGQLLGCCSRTVSRRRVPGRVKLGRLTKYVRSEVESWIAAGCPTATASPSAA